MISSPVIHDNTNLKRITAFCREVRLFLTDHWTAFHALNPETSQYRSTATRPTPSRSMCRFTSGFLLPRLLDRFPQERWKVRSGAATPGPDTAGRWRFSPAGLQDRDGVWHSHYWIEDHTGLIIDLTADQFGWSPVTVTRDPSVAPPPPSQPGPLGTRHPHERRPMANPAPLGTSLAKPPSGRSLPPRGRGLVWTLCH